MSVRRPAPSPEAASVPTPKNFNATWLRSSLRGLVGQLRGRRLCVAYSGGMDSSALLAALATLHRAERFALRAVHVNHQLHPQALRWARAAQANARRLGLRCQVLKVHVAHAAGESLEAAAREARYGALAAQLADDELLLTAHHLEDQLETLLLALIRGSGVAGLSAMSAATPWAGTLLLRPLLPIGRAQLQRFARRRGIEWTEDPSNQDQRFDRNYLRHAVLPLMTARWPALATTGARCASNLAEARAILTRVAQEALTPARDGAGLRVSVLRRLPLSLRRNALRQWLSERGLPAPDHRRMREASGPLLAAREDAQALVRWEGGELRRHADRLFAFGADKAHASAAAHEIGQWDWRAAPWLSLGAAGTLGLVRDPHGDVQLQALPARLAIRYRAGGERLHAEGGRVALKDLLQQRGIAPWARATVPLVMHGERVLAVADLWLDRHYSVRQDATRHGADPVRGRFRWRPALAAPVP